MAMRPSLHLVLEGLGVAEAFDDVGESQNGVVSFEGGVVHIPEDGLIIGPVVVSRGDQQGESAGVTQHVAVHGNVLRGADLDHVVAVRINVSFPRSVKLDLVTRATEIYTTTH